MASASGLAPGATPLLDAAQAGDYTRASELLASNGAALRERNILSMTPLHCAAHNGHATIVRLLLRHHASLEDVDEWDMTALHVAVGGGHVAIVTDLIAAGADLAARERNGCTPLHCAAMYGRGAVYRQLLEAGADVCALDDQGRTPCECAGAGLVARELRQLDCEFGASAIGRVHAQLQRVVDDVGALKAAAHKARLEGEGDAEQVRRERDHLRADRARLVRERDRFMDERDLLRIEC